MVLDLYEALKCTENAHRHSPETAARHAADMVFDEVLVIMGKREWASPRQHSATVTYKRGCRKTTR